jgi:uncharacterized protein YqhQ
MGGQAAPMGGQAVIEGVMMRSPDKAAVAVRKADGDIALKVEQIPRWTKANPVFALPFLRGIITLAETMVLGINSLMYSAEEAGGENEKITAKEMGISLTLSVLITIALFIALPAAVFAKLRALPIDTLVLNLIEGAIRISIFVGFLAAISFMPDMRRVFQYHGAEHKTINAYESLSEKSGFSTDDIKPEAVRNFSAIHPSCGTSFLLMVLLTSIVLFTFLGRPPFLQRIVLKLAMLPVVAGISYEIVRLARKKTAWPLVKFLVSPGMWLQKITTREPDASQIEVAIAALKAAL